MSIQLAIAQQEASERNIQLKQVSVELTGLKDKCDYQARDLVQKSG